MIEHIESLRPELHGHALADGCVLEHTHIKDDLARRKQQVSRRVSVSERSRYCKSSSIEPAAVERSEPESVGSLTRSARLEVHPACVALNVTENGTPLRMYVIPATCHPPMSLLIAPDDALAKRFPGPKGEIVAVGGGKDCRRTWSEFPRSARCCRDSEARRQPAYRRATGSRSTPPGR